MKNIFNGLTLERYPRIKNDQFQAWNAADEYILKHLKDINTDYRNVLIIEDEFGALSLSVQAERKFIVCDSIVNQKGITENAKINNYSFQYEFLNPFADFPDPIDLVIIKIPKNNIYLDFLLQKLISSFSHSVPIIAGGMTKHLNKSVFHIFDSNLSNMHTTLARKKARLIIARADPKPYLGTPTA